MKNCPQTKNNPDNLFGSGSNYSSVELQTKLLMSLADGLSSPLGNILKSSKEEGATLESG